MPRLIIIAAIAESNRVIGRDRDLPWHIPEDLKRFKRLTRGHPILMGRKTFESILHQFGQPLPDRRNIVLTRRTNPWRQYEIVETYGGLDEALHALAGEPVVFIGGGAALYEQFLPLADEMELTLVEGTYDGDTFFPPYEHLIGTEYETVHEEPHDGYRFVTYRRIASRQGNED